jgi:hypothetical protein
MAAFLTAVFLLATLPQRSLCRTSFPRGAMANVLRDQLTFFATSDTHFGHSINGSITAAQLNLQTIEQMHRTPGMRLPTGQQQRVGVPAGKALQPAPSRLLPQPPPAAPSRARAAPAAGVLITGDLVDAGSDPLLCAQQWQQFEETYGLGPGQGRLQFPVLEGG